MFLLFHPVTTLEEMWIQDGGTVEMRFEVPLQTKSSADTVNKYAFSLDHFLIVFSNYTSTLQKLLQSGTLILGTSGISAVNDGRESMQLTPSPH